MKLLSERLEERATFEDERVLKEAKAIGFVPEVYSGSQTGALLREAAELARRVEDAPAADIRDDGKNGGESALLSAATRAGYYQGQRVALVPLDAAGSAEGVGGG